jgi:intracellular sulfur oxidation DsrE/DsrF family protein
MKPFRRTLLAVTLATVSAAAAAGETPDFWQTPALTGVGQMHPLPKAAYQPQQAVTYKVVFALTKAGDKPGEASPSLERVARTVNLYASAGVPLDHMKFVAVLYGPATAAALDNAHYKQLLGVDNPNLELIHKLHAAGIDVAVCGQAVAEHQFDYAWINPEVTLALSALTTITVLENQGYALMPL